MNNFVCLTAPSVVTVPFETSKPKTFNAFICNEVHEDLVKSTIKWQGSNLAFKTTSNEKQITSTNYV